MSESQDGTSKSEAAESKEQVMRGRAECNNLNVIKKRLLRVEKNYEFKIKTISDVGNTNGPYRTMCKS
jgi:flagellar basal body rod protein FlgF